MERKGKGMKINEGLQNKWIAWIPAMYAWGKKAHHMRINQSQSNQSLSYIKFYGRLKSEILFAVGSPSVYVTCIVLKIKIFSNWQWEKPEK